MVGTKASLTQRGVCSRGWRVLEGVLNNSNPDSAQNFLRILLAWAERVSLRSRGACVAQEQPVAVLEALGAGSWFSPRGFRADR